MAKKRPRREKKACGQTESSSSERSLDETRRSDVHIDSKQGEGIPRMADKEVPTHPVSAESRNELIMNVKNLIEQNFKELKYLRTKKAQENILLNKQELKLNNSKQSNEAAIQKLESIQNEYNKLAKVYSRIDVSFKLDKFGKMKAKNKEDILRDLSVYLRKQRVLREEIPRLKKEYEIRKNWSVTLPPILLSPAMTHLNTRFIKEFGTQLVIVMRPPVENCMKLPFEQDAGTLVNYTTEPFVTISKARVKMPVIESRNFNNLSGYSVLAKTEFKQHCQIQKIRPVVELTDSTPSLLKDRNDENRNCNERIWTFVGSDKWKEVEDTKSDTETSIGTVKELHSIYGAVLHNKSVIDPHSRSAKASVTDISTAFLSPQTKGVLLIKTDTKPVTKIDKAHLIKKHAASHSTSVTNTSENSRVPDSKLCTVHSPKDFFGRKSISDRKDGFVKLSGQHKSSAILSKQINPVNIKSHTNENKQLGLEKSRKTASDIIRHTAELKYESKMKKKQNDDKIDSNGRAKNSLAHYGSGNKGTYVQTVGNESFIYAKRSIPSGTTAKINVHIKDSNFTNQISPVNRRKLQKKVISMIEENETDLKTLNSSNNVANSQQNCCFPVRTTAYPLIIIGQTRIPILIRTNGLDKKQMTKAKLKDVKVKNHQNIKSSRIPVYQPACHLERKSGNGFTEESMQNQTYKVNNGTNRSSIGYENKKMENMHSVQFVNAPGKSFEKRCSSLSKAKNEVRSATINSNHHIEDDKKLTYLERMNKRNKSSIEKAAFSAGSGHKFVTNRENVPKHFGVYRESVSSADDGKLAEKATGDIFGSANQTKLSSQSLAEGNFWLTQNPPNVREYYNNLKQSVKVKRPKIEDRMIPRSVNSKETNHGDILFSSKSFETSDKNLLKYGTKNISNNFQSRLPVPIKALSHKKKCKR